MLASLHSVGRPGVLTLPLLDSLLAVETELESGQSGLESPGAHSYVWVESSLSLSDVVSVEEVLLVSLPSSGGAPVSLPVATPKVFTVMSPPPTAGLPVAGAGTTSDMATQRMTCPLGTSLGSHDHFDVEAAVAVLSLPVDEHATVVAAIAPARRTRMTELDAFSDVILLMRITTALAMPALAAG
jgi:hypothetical protein